MTKQGFLVSGAASSYLTGKACTQYHPLDLRHVYARQRTAARPSSPAANVVLSTADYALFMR